MELPLLEIFDIDLGARPATYTEDYTVDEPIEHEIPVAFLRDQAQTFEVQNAAPAAWARTEDVPNIGTKSKLVIHYGYLLDENGNRILDESREPIIAENEFTYYVSAVHADAFKVTKMELTLVAPN